MEYIKAIQAPVKQFEIIQGVRENSQLLYIFSEKKLYVRKVKRNGATEFICYETIFGKNEKKTITVKINALPVLSCFLMIC